jgi:hypothetical protein
MVGLLDKAFLILVNIWIRKKKFLVIIFIQKFEIFKMNVEVTVLIKKPLFIISNWR